MRNITILIFLTVSLLVSTIQASTNALYFGHYSSENGLSQMSISSILQDKLGRLWFATREGLSIYNGNSMHTFKPSQKDTIGNPLYFSGNDVWNLTSDSEGNIFFLVNQHLVRYDFKKETFCEYDKHFSCITFHSNNIYLYGDSSLYVWNDYLKTSEKVIKTPLKTMNNLCSGPSGKLWLCHNNGLYSWTIGEDKIVRMDSIVGVNTVISCKNGDFWIGYRTSGVCRIKVNGEKIFYNEENATNFGFKNNHIRQFVEDEAGNIWFGTFEGLHKFDIKTERFEVYEKDYKPGSLTNSSIYSLFIDKEQTLWIGSYYGGINYLKLKQKEYSYYSYNTLRDDCLTHPLVGNMAEDKNGKIWICTEGGGLNCLDPLSNRIQQFKSNEIPFFLPHTNLKSIAYDSIQHKLYIGSYQHGLYSYDIDKDLFYHFPQKGDNRNTIPCPSISALIIDKRTLYISSFNDLYKMDLSSEESILLKKDIYSSSICIDNQGFLWLMNNSGIEKRDLNGNVIQKYTFPKEYESFTAIECYETSNGNFYIGTNGGGVLIFNSHSQLFTPFPSKKRNLISDYCYRIREGKAGEIIIMGNKGIAVVMPEGDISRLFTTGSELPLGSFMKECGLLLSKQGMVYAGGTNGLCSFPQNELNKRIKLPEIYFSELYIHNELILPSTHQEILPITLPETSELTLSHEENNLRITIASMQLNDTFMPELYEYQLEGFDNRWLPTIGSTISFTNIPPGKYKLKVRPQLSTLINSQSASIKVLPITILQAWYKTPWAITLWTTLFVLLMLYFEKTLRIRRILKQSLEMERMEKKNIKELNEAKLRFFTNISHEFRTPLTLIASQLDMILQTKNIPPTLYNRALKIRRQSQQMHRLISELLDFSRFEQKHYTLKISETNLQTFMREISVSFQDVAINRNISYDILLPHETINIWMDITQMQKVIYNLLSNAFKFTADGGKVEIILDNSNTSAIVIKVIDSGIGIATDQLPKIFNRFYQADNASNPNLGIGGSGIGLALVKSIVEAHQGTIEVESKEGAGSIFAITLLKGKTHFDKAERVEFIEQNKLSSTEIATIPTITNKQVSVEEEEGNYTKSKYTILIVEDNLELLETMIEIFTPFYQIETAINGEDGIEKVRQIMPDLIISDVIMPKISGLELCQTIKTDIDLSHIPLILLTALNLPEHNLEGFKCGADDYVGKPFNARVLLARCNNLIRNRKILIEKFTKKPDTNIELLATTSIDKEFLEKVVSIIERFACESSFDINRLAAELAMSRSGLFAKFKSLTGMTPNDFVRGQKLKMAADVLKNNREKSIADVAQQFSFCSASYFSKCFKEIFGVSPAEYRG